MPNFAIFWLPEAVREKDEIVDYIGSHNLRAALAIDAQIARQVGQLADFAYLGKKGRVDGTLELIVSGTPYVVSYRLYGSEVQILHLFHARRNWPPKVSE